MKKLTPLAELIEQLKLMKHESPHYSKGLNSAIFIAQSLLPKEKQGIIDAIQNHKLWYRSPYKNAGEQYFNETYRQ